MPKIIINTEGKVGKVVPEDGTIRSYLMEKLRGLAPPGSIILDPLAGSGSTLVRVTDMRAKARAARLSDDDQGAG